MKVAKYVREDDVVTVKGLERLGIPHE